MKPENKLTTMTTKNDAKKLKKFEGKNIKILPWKKNLKVYLSIIKK